MIKNFIATLFLSQGIPMILAGDEIRRTQHGNNNTYCHDNDLSWINWDFLTTHHEIHRFPKMMIPERELGGSAGTRKKDQHGYDHQQHRLFHGMLLSMFAITVR